MKFPRQDNVLTAFFATILIACCLTLVYHWVVSSDSVASETTQMRQ